MMRTRKVKRAVKRIDLNSTLGLRTIESKDHCSGKDEEANMAATERARRTEGLMPPPLLSRAMALEMVGDGRRRWPSSASAASMVKRERRAQR